MSEVPNPKLTIVDLTLWTFAGPIMRGTWERIVLLGEEAAPMGVLMAKGFIEALQRWKP